MTVEITGTFSSDGREMGAMVKKWRKHIRFQWVIEAKPTSRLTKVGKNWVEIWFRKKVGVEVCIIRG